MTKLERERIQRGLLTISLSMECYADEKDSEGDKAEARDIRAALAWLRDVARPQLDAPPSA